MPATTLLPKLIAATGMVIAIALGFHTYTLPNHSAAAYEDIHTLIGEALGDPREQLPGPPAALTLEQLPPPAMAVEADSASLPAPGQPRTWVRAARATDSAALRGWLSPLVLVTAAVHGDTTETTLWRVTGRHGCPLVSRLHAVSVRPGTTGRSATIPRLIRLEGDCPADAARGAS